MPTPGPDSPRTATALRRSIETTVASGGNRRQRAESRGTVPDIREPPRSNDLRPNDLHPRHTQQDEV